MSLLILITLQLFLEVRTEGLPQAKLTVFPTSVTDGEMVHFVCEGFEKRRVSECMFYPSGQANLTLPNASCYFSIIVSELIQWSGDHESSHVNIICYYTVTELGKYITSPHSDEVSVEVRGPHNRSTMMFSVKTSQDGGFSTGSAVTSSVSQITDNSSTRMFSSQTSQAALPTMSTPFTMNITTSFDVTFSAETTTDLITNASNIITHNRHILTDPAKKATEINKYLNTKMLFSVMVAAAGGGLVLVGLMVICMYGCRRRPRAERIWIESTSKKCGEVSIPMVGSGSCGDEAAEFYSTIDVLPYTAEPSGIKDEQSKQNEVELSQLYSTVTKPAIIDSGDIYSLPMPH